MNACLHQDVARAEVEAWAGSVGNWACLLSVFEQDIFPDQG